MEPVPNHILEQKIQELERQVRQQDRTLAGIKHWLKVAAEYKNDDPVRLIAGIQAALLKAQDYQGREQKTRRKGGR